MSAQERESKGRGGSGILGATPDCHSAESVRKSPIERSVPSRTNDYVSFLPEKASPKKTAAKIKKTVPMPEESLVKSTMAITRNVTPARALPNLCLDIFG